MGNCTGCDVPFSKGDKLSSEQSPKTEQERLEMKDKPYASLVGSLMCCSGMEEHETAKSIQLWNDNTAAVYFAQGNKRSSGMRHLHLKFLSAKEKIRDGETTLSHIGTDFMIADPLNKGLPNHVFHRHVASMGLQFSFDA
ncbi:unnamed protein product [Prunus brigantina]